MMYDELYYFDGCSYVYGHDVNSVRTPWLDVINPEVTKDGNYNQTYMPHDRDNAANVYRKKPYYNMSLVAKSNPEIFNDFMSTLPKLIEANNVSVIIQWSHSERTTQDKNQGFLNLRSTDKFQPDLWWDGVVRTVEYMYKVQELCKKHNLNYSFITTEHPSIFKHVEKYSNDKYTEQLEKIDEKFIFNWPLRNLENFNLDINTKERALLLWGCTSLHISWCKAFNEEPASDFKHLGDNARRRFGVQVRDWITDRDKDLSYWIDESNNCNNNYFYNLKAWLDNYWDGNASHWVEKQLQGLLLETEIKPNADYIYES